MTDITSIKALIASVTGVPENELSDNSSVESVAAWDSIAHINIILAIEQAYDVRVPLEQAAELTSIIAIRDFIAGQAGI